MLKGFQNRSQKLAVNNMDPFYFLAEGFEDFINFWQESLKKLGLPYLTNPWSGIASNSILNSRICLQYTYFELFLPCEIHLTQNFALH